MKTKTTIIVWFRTDLRLHDNPALYAADSHAERIIPVYIHAPHEEGQWQPGAASRWWLHYSLSSLGRDLRKLGSRLIIRAGNSLEQLQQLADETGAIEVYTTRCYSPDCIKRDNNLQQALRTAGIGFTLFNGNLLLEPDNIRNKAGNAVSCGDCESSSCCSGTMPGSRPKKCCARTNPRDWPPGGGGACSAVNGVYAEGRGCAPITGVESS